MNPRSLPVPAGDIQNGGMCRTEQWDDWRWQMQNAIRTTLQLAEFMPLAPQELSALESLEAKYKLAIPPYYLSLIDFDDPADPIALQSLPSTRELSSESGLELEDPLEEDKDSPVPGLTHRYPRPWRCW